MVLLYDLFRLQLCFVMLEVISVIIIHKYNFLIIKEMDLDMCNQQLRIITKYLQLH